MGLMDSLIGAATQALAGQGPGQGPGGSGPDWVGIVSGLLANGSAQGGLGGLGGLALAAACGAVGLRAAARCSALAFLSQAF